ncbi:MAG TPA: hypothetical protein VMU29_07715 [Smithella sp.]|nr:hypothetical protein [Smithella sp.]
MDQKQFTKQVMDLYKIAFNNIFFAMNTMQDQAEKLFSGFLDKAPWIPQEGKKAMSDWMSFYKKNCDDFKNMINENFKKAEDYFTVSQSK